jgi:DMSO reductase anchor subunit
MALKKAVGFAVVLMGDILMRPAINTDVTRKSTMSFKIKIIKILILILIIYINLLKWTETCVCTRSHTGAARLSLQNSCCDNGQSCSASKALQLFFLQLCTFSSKNQT